ncbi:MAG: type II toxin-antitoxin system VapC family toxin [Lautropia sp.]|nr:type II toxin-antitoxin system VapC family toxin [Lautropia sp.]
MYLLDTNVLSELRSGKRNASENVLAWAASVPMEQQYVSPVTLAEIELGILRLERKKPPQGKSLRTWFVHLQARFKPRLLVIDERVAQRYVTFQLRDPMPVNDAWIAATAAVHGMIVVTRNVRDFQAAGVRVLNPWE